MPLTGPSPSAPMALARRIAAEYPFFSVAVGWEILSSTWPRPLKFSSPLPDETGGSSFVVITVVESLSECPVVAPATPSFRVVVAVVVSAASTLARDILEPDGEPDSHDKKLSSVPALFDPSIGVTSGCRLVVSVGKGLRSHKPSTFGSAERLILLLADILVSGQQERKLVDGGRTRTPAPCIVLRAPSLVTAFAHVSVPVCTVQSVFMHDCHLCIYRILGVHA